ncbi:MAG: GNAT family N-acetyltransferase [Erysipelotrichaceae bacterium]|nr:GNAT family N-acetyltransferase [Erysipelotrichaceae bacterium]
MDNKIELEDLLLIKVDKNNLKHLEYLKKLFQNKEDKSMDFLGQLDQQIDDNTFIVQNKHDKKVGYFAMSKPVINYLGLSSISLYYTIEPTYRSKGYATILLQEMSQYLLEKNDMLVLNIHKKNLASRRVAEKAGFQLEFTSDEEEEEIYTKYAQKQKKIRRW